VSLFRYHVAVDGRVLAGGGAGRWQKGGGFDIRGGTEEHDPVRSGIPDVDELLARCLEGEPAARDGFVGRYAAIIYGAVERVIRSRRPADPSLSIEDIAQEVFLKLFRSDARLLRTYDAARASLSTWLTIVARSTALDLLRRKHPATVPFEPASHSPVVEPPRVVDRVEIPRDLLSVRQELVMRLLYDREMQVSEAARLMGVAEQTVRSTRHKALNKLRAAFGTRDAPGRNLTAEGDVKRSGDV